MVDDFSITDKHPSNELFSIPGANEKWDKIMKIAKRIHESRGVSFASREPLKIEGAEWEVRPHYGKTLILPNRLAFLDMLRITEEDLCATTPQLAQEFESAIAEFRKLMDGAQKDVRKMIPFNAIEESIIKFAAGQEGINVSRYVNKAAMTFAHLNAYPPDGIKSGNFGIQQASKCAMLGVKLHDAFTPDEVENAITATGLDYATGKKLMAELERLREARKNSDLMAGGSMNAPE